MVPRLRLIAGSYYWRPTKAIKKLGYSNVPLGKDEAKAITEARALNAEVERVQRGEQLPSIRKGSISEIIALYRASPKFKKLAPKTRKDYGNILNLLESNAGHVAVVRVERTDVVDMYDELIEERGLAMANAIMRVFRIIMEMAYNRGWRGDNPVRKLDMTAVEARERVWTDEEVETFCRAAEENGRASLSLAVRLALDIGQRQGDLLALKWGDWDGSGFLIRQRKTRTAVAVAATAPMAAELNAMPRSSVYVIVSEATKRPYKEDHFRHEFARIRDLAGLPKDLRFQDLRRTAATELGAAGATDDQLRAVTGHRSRGVVAVYVRPDSSYSREAQRKREENRKARAGGKTGGKTATGETGNTI